MKLILAAFDEHGNTFRKTVTFREGANQEPTKYGDYYGDVISFGWPCEYYIKSLKKQFYPFKKDFCIDGMGQNHKGYPVL